MPDFPIIDTHVHLYDPAAVSYGWMKSMPALNTPHLLPHYDEETRGLEIEAVVFVEVDADQGAHLAEARFVAEYAKSHPRIKAIIGSIPLEHGLACERDLAAFAQLPGARGVRRLIQSHTEPGWCLRHDFIAAVRLLPKYHLHFELCLYHHQLADVIELCERCPGVAFILDHVAKPGIKSRLWQPWADHLATLAKLTNVSCKISGVVTEADHRAWTEAEVTPYINHAIACFGFDRLMFGSDWPVCGLATPVQKWVALLDGVLQSNAEIERRKFYRDTAIRLYGMNVAHNGA
jgi:L-fuconolactonase